MPEPRWDVREAAQGMVQSGAHGLSVAEAYASPVARRGAHEAALRELMHVFGVRKDTASSALSWALAQARGEEYHSGRKPGTAPSTPPTNSLKLTQAERAYCKRHGGVSRVVHALLAAAMAAEESHA